MVLEIEDVGDDQDKAFLIGAVLVRLTEHLRLRRRHEPGRPTELRHLTVLEKTRLDLVRTELTAPVFQHSPQARELDERIEEFGQESITAELHSLSGDGTG